VARVVVAVGAAAEVVAEDSPVAAGAAGAVVGAEGGATAAVAREVVRLRAGLPKAGRGAMRVERRRRVSVRAGACGCPT
jgi:hypothetical protein